MGFHAFSLATLPGRINYIGKLPTVKYEKGAYKSHKKGKMGLKKLKIKS